MLGRRGHCVVDTDSDEWCYWKSLPDGSPDWVWREAAMTELLTGHQLGTLFVSPAVGVKIHGDLRDDGHAGRADGAGGGIRTRTDGHLKTAPLPLGYAGLLPHTPGVRERVAVPAQDTRVLQAVVGSPGAGGRGLGVA